MATEVAAAATAVAADGVDQPQLRVVGRLNVNTATREQLLQVPGLDAAAVEALLEARVQQPIVEITRVTAVPDEALRHLKTSGASNFTRLLQHPLQRLGEAPHSHALR